MPFADLCNNILYGGREVILPENLKERDTTEVLTALGLDKKDHSGAEAEGYFQKMPASNIPANHMWY